MINSTEKTISLSASNRNNYIIKELIELYYFEKTSHDSNSRIWMRDHSFAKRLYCFKNSKLYVGYGWTKSMDYDTELGLLFPKKIKQGVYYKHRDGDYWKSFRYVAKETIKVNGTEYKDCMKIDIYETLGSSKRTATVWFAKKVGLVKWDMKNENVNYIHL